MKRVLSAFIIALSLGTVSATSLTGCPGIGVQRPETFNERMVAGYKTVEAVASSASMLLDAGKLSVEDAKNVHAQATTAKEGLDITRQIHDGGDFTSAEARLQAIITGLGAVQTYLVAKGK